jgi:para-nitrobenzyl esterase
MVTPNERSVRWVCAAGAATMLLAAAVACSSGGSDAPVDGSGGEEGEAPDERDGDAGEVESDGLMADATPSQDVSSDSADPPEDTSAPCEPAAAAGEGVVITRHGAFQGAKSGEVWAFLGIPYASPPVGDRRWQPPAEPSCATELQSALTFASECTQQRTQPNGQVSFVGEEDCLYANVWTPSPTKDGARPVWVFVHGGGNVQGSASVTLPGGANTYNGARIAGNQDAVVVTFNYRLGPLGYFANPALEAESNGEPFGNYGLLDQIRLLEWVSENIEEFGGDPAQVFLFGESAGAVNVCALLAAPKARGLFARAGMQSGFCSAITKAQAFAIADNLLANTVCSTADNPLECLRSLPPRDIVEARPGSIDIGATNTGGDAGGNYGPIIDGALLAQGPLTTLAAGAHTKVPFLIGSNADELGNLLQVQDITEAQFETIVSQAFGALGSDGVAALLAAYAPDNFASPRDALVQLYSDLRFTCTTRLVARFVANNQDEPVYRYFFDHAASTPNSKGAVHALELLYLYGTIQDVPQLTVTDSDIEVVGSLQRYWGRFAAGGDPNGAADPAWPRYVAESDPHLVISADPAADEGVHTERCDLWEALLLNP